MKNPLVVAQKKEGDQVGMGDETREVDNGEFVSLKELDNGECAH